PPPLAPARLGGAPTWPPTPPTFAASRQSRDAALSRWLRWGPDMAPKPPDVRRVPAKPRRGSVAVASVGPRHGPQTPRRSPRPGKPATGPGRGGFGGAPTWLPNPHRSPRSGTAWMRVGSAA